MADNDLLSFEDFMAVVKIDKRGGKANREAFSPNTDLADSTWGSKSPVQQDFTKRILAAKKTPQAVFRLISKGTGIQRAGAMVDYISRKGELEVENREGELLQDREDHKKELEKWALDFSKRKNGVDVHHMTVSTPRGTSPEAALRAARSFAKEAFSENEYLFTRHDDTKNPHIHFIIKNKSDLGKSLPTRKADLESYRDIFSHHCREQGIAVASSRKSWRGAGMKSKAQSIHHLEKNGRAKYINDKNAKVDKDTGRPWEKKIRDENTKQRKIYMKLSDRLAQQQGMTGLKTGVPRMLERFARTMPQALTKQQLLRKEAAKKAIAKTTRNLRDI
jgi:hypothetical protein